MIESKYLVLVGKIKRLVPDWEPHQQQHVVNLVTNRIRGFNNDIYHIEVTLTRGSPFQYSTERVIHVNGKIFYIYFQVD